ncbi:sugar porter family MFS transporter [Pseudoalteromonas sp. SSDWG2]|uniref:sugar porter family MFS transporter n=1 Tax=Pseudoalteromonas sp. SSDWG2 TaxID=3139391 RepID=UPI003BA96597
MEQIAKQSQQSQWYAFFISIAAALGGFLFGFDSGVINGTIDGLTQAFGADDIGSGFNVASMLIGCAVGALLAGRLSDLLGRKRLLMIAAVLFIVSAVGSGIANSSFEFVIYRLIGGLAVGGASIIAPAYIAEIAPVAIRGRLASMQQIAIILGLFGAFISNYLIALNAGGSTAVWLADMQAWRWMFLVEVAPASLFFLVLLFIPESPRVLVALGRNQDALAVLVKLVGEQEAQAKLDAIVNDIASTATHKDQQGSWQELSTPTMRPLMVAGVGLAALQQLVGINVVFYYGAVLWQAVGFTEADALLINILSGGLSILACAIAIAKIDSLGRKPLLLIGSVGMFVAMAVLVVVFANAEQSPSGALELGDMGIWALIAANVYVFFFNLSWGPVMWVMLGEMFPNKVRGKALSVSGLVQWFTNFMVTLSFPILLAGIGLTITYGIYALFAFLSIFFVVRYIKETRGIELEQMG